MTRFDKARMFMVALLAVFAALGTYLWLTTHPARGQDTSPKPQENTESPQNGDFAVKRDALDDWLDRLETYENCPWNGIIDSNGKRSYGPYCYQETTYLMFVKKFNLMPHAEEGELLNNLSDYSMQRKMTRMIIEEDHSAWRNWFTTVKIRKMGEPPHL